MRRAIELARRAWGDTHPNPLVGAVIVEKGEIVAEGWHAAAGGDHAEVAAIRALGRKPEKGAVLYVSLEPCSTRGRTGACTDAIIQAGFTRVVVGTQDPNPDHCGRGMEILREAGIDVVDSVLSDACADLNLIFNHRMKTGSPLIAAKIAMTLDGKFSASSGQSQWVTGEAARADVMRWRRYFPAIAVSAATALQDDPSLTSRIEGATRCPRRFVFDRALKTITAGRTLKLFSDRYVDRTVLLCGESVDAKLQSRAKSLGVSVWTLPECEGHLDWQFFRRRCLAEAIDGIWVEAGPGLATACIEKQLADYLFVYQAPKLLSDASAKGIGSRRESQSMAEVWTLSELQQESLGEDRLIRGFLS